jgi:hypothetical protein
LGASNGIPERPWAEQRKDGNVDESTNRPKSWFEMAELRGRFYDRSVWIPLRARKALARRGELNGAGFTEEYFGVGSIIVPVSQRELVERLSWDDVGHRGAQRGYLEENEYVPSHVSRHNGGAVCGEHLILERAGNGVECAEWLLSQDLVVTLGLKREEDLWVALTRGYEEVAKLERDDEGCPDILTIRASYLKDYLCARRMGLYVSSYRSRVQVVDDAAHVNWSEPCDETVSGGRWAGRVTAIHECGGMPFGDEITVMHVGRLDVDYDEDIPTFGLAGDERVSVKSLRATQQGRKVYRIHGEMWRNEWIAPAPNSDIVGGEKGEPTAFFFTDNSGTKESRATLRRDSRWLWFKPTIVNAILDIRGSSLEWYTRNTGSLACAPGQGVQFGVNSIGLVNVFAKDIGLLPDWQQQMWAGSTIAPDGKVSQELLMSQMEAKPASTKAPEAYLRYAIESVNRVAVENHGIPIFDDHAGADRILARTHRFAATSRDGFLELAKNVYRVTAERIDSARIKKIVKPQEAEKWGALKALERLLALRMDGEAAYKLLSPLWGIYELRQADSHLPSSELEKSYRLAGVDPHQIALFQGWQLLDAAVSSLFRISKALRGPARSA